MEVAQFFEYPSFEAFQNRIKSNYLFVDMDKLHVIYTNSRDDRLDFTYPDQRLLNGTKETFKDWPLFGGPFVNSKKGSKIIQIQYQSEKVTLDFNHYSVKLEKISN